MLTSAERETSACRWDGLRRDWCCEDERLQRISITRSRSISAVLVTRARIVLAAADGEPDGAVARRLQLTRADGKWPPRFLEQRINGLPDEVHLGKPRTIDDERITQLIHKTLHTKTRRWVYALERTYDCRRNSYLADQCAPLPQAVGSATTSQRKRQALDRSVFHREIARCGRPLPESAGERIVLCVDEKIQCQALERTQRMLPMDSAMFKGALMTTGRTLLRCDHQQGHTPWLVRFCQATG